MSFDPSVPAPPEVLPALLADPPWRKRRGKPPVFLDLTAPDSPTTVEWAPGERDEWLTAPFDLLGSGDRAVTADRLRSRETVDWREAAEFFVAGPEEPARALLAEWKPVPAPECDAAMRRIAARFEADALLPLRRLAFHDSVLAGPLMLPFRSPDVVWRMQVGVHDEGRYADIARTWLDRHPGFAARHLLPRAFGPDGRSRRSAQHTLVQLAATGHVETLRSVAESYGPEAAAATEALIGTDPLAILPVKLPAIPQWFDPTTLPPVRLRSPTPSGCAPPLSQDAGDSGGTQPVVPFREAEGSGGTQPVALPSAALRDLAMVFALHDVFEPYSGVEVVREACEPADLARFAWGLFEAWLAAGANSRQGWVLDALGLVGDDETVRCLTPLIMEWPGQNGHTRAVTGLRILARIGTDLALLHIDRIAGRTRFSGLRSAAEREIAHLAERRGLTAEQLADRLAPDLGLDGDGSLTLDYGPRRFVVGFDQELQPFVTDSSGKRLKSLPKPGASDDPERATAAHRRFTVLKKDARTIAAEQIRRLERAMVAGRRWPEAEFRRFFAGHPLLRHPARRLLWGRYDAKGVLSSGFRVAEDGTFADLHDRVTTLTGGEVIGVVHPIHLGQTLPQWSEVFADYRILQPFPQLGRETATLTADEAAGVVLTRFQGRRVLSRAVLALESRGWRRGTMRDSRTQTSVIPSLADGLELELDPGIVHGAVDRDPEQILGPVRLYSQVSTLGDLDPVVISEVIRDLELLTGGH
jgi:hypothetical protein